MKSSRIRLSIFILIFSFGVNTCIHSAIVESQVAFYTELLTIHFDSETLTPSIDYLGGQNIKNFQNSLEHTDVQPLLEDLKKYKDRFNLNDWLYYDMMLKTINTIASKKSSLERQLICWHLLSKAGYNTRLTFKASEAFVYVSTIESIFETPMIMDGETKFINLTSVHRPIADPTIELDLYGDHLNPSGKAFSFDIKSLPILRSKPKLRRLIFQANNKSYDIDILLDENAFEIMQHYPIVEEIKYVKLPLSQSLQSSLIPQIKDYIKELPEKEALQFIVSFTRTAFQYKDDLNYFGKSKPMISDELFHYPYSDCEDRSALFYNLTKELLGLPMIVIAYDDHLTIAVASTEVLGPSIIYGNKKYYICDPTGPNNTNEIGNPPKGYEKRSFSILGKG